YTDALTQATSGSRPYYMLDTDGDPAIQCVGNRALTSPTWTSPPSTGPITLFMVYRVHAVGSSGSMYLTDAPSSSNRIRYTMLPVTGQRAIAVNGGSTVALPNQPAIDDQWKVEVLTFKTAGSVDAWFNT